MFLRKKLFIACLASTCITTATFAETSRILFIGNTGAGKTTLINGTFNFAKNKGALHNYKFIEKLDQEDITQTPDSDIYMAPESEVNKNTYARINSGVRYLGSSDTQTITGYRFTPCLPSWSNDLELIDSPGLNDTHSASTARKIVDKLETYLRQNPDSLDAIVLVLESSMVRASKTCVDALERIKALFPEEMAQKFFVVVNFSHKHEPIKNNLVKIVNENLSEQIEKEQFNKMNLIYLAQHNDYTGYASSNISWDHYAQEKSFSEHAIGKLLKQVQSQNKKLTTYNYSLFNDLRLSVVGCLKQSLLSKKRAQQKKEVYNSKQDEKVRVRKLMNAINLYEFKSVEQEAFNYQTKYRMERKRVPCQIEVWEDEVSTVSTGPKGSGVGAGAAIGTLLLPGIGTLFGAILGGAASNQDEQRVRRVKRVKDSYKYKEIQVAYQERVAPFTRTIQKPVRLPENEKKIKDYQNLLDKICQELNTLGAQSTHENQESSRARERASEFIQKLKKNPYGHTYAKDATKLKAMLHKAFAQRYPELIFSQTQETNFEKLLKDLIINDR